jgi:calcineurin-like phosphoesterase family protein
MVIGRWGLQGGYICTHYDNDHLGGIWKLIEEYHQCIQEIWIHKIAETLDEHKRIMQNELIKLKEQTKHNEGFYRRVGYSTDKHQMILEGYTELIKVIEKIIDYDLDKIAFEPVRGKQLKGFEEFEVVSPTPNFYNKRISSLKNEKLLMEVQEDQIKGIVNEVIENGRVRESINEDICNQLETSSIKNNVTDANLISIVTRLNIDGKIYLFTGDAGIETFEEQDILQEDIKNIEWLDLPHHGSKNNTSAKMLSHFNPKVVFVSGNNQENRPNKLIKKCLEKKSRFRKMEVTNETQNTWYLKYNQDGKIERIKWSK